MDPPTSMIWGGCYCLFLCVCIVCVFFSLLPLLLLIIVVLFCSVPFFFEGGGGGGVFVLFLWKEGFFF